MPNDDQNVLRASKLDTTAISDAMDRLGIAGQCLGIKPLEARVQYGYHQLQRKPR